MVVEISDENLRSLMTARFTPTDPVVADEIRKLQSTIRLKGTNGTRIVVMCGGHDDLKEARALAEKENIPGEISTTLCERCMQLLYPEYYDASDHSK